jgi:hypothetical protein
MSEVDLKRYMEKLEEKYKFNHQKAWLTQATRPSVLFTPILEKLETTPGSVIDKVSSKNRTYQWTANYGSLIGVGKTPEEAMLDFDKKWREP